MVFWDCDFSLEGSSRLIEEGGRQVYISEAATSDEDVESVIRYSIDSNCTSHREAPTL